MTSQANNLTAICPFNLPDLFVYFIKTLSSEDFGFHLNLNCIWRTECEKELWKRQKKAKAEYWVAVKEYEKLSNLLHELDYVYDQGLCDEMSAALDRMDISFIEQAKAEEALIRCEFITQNYPDYDIFEWHIKLHNDGFTPNGMCLYSEAEEQERKWKEPGFYFDNDEIEPMLYIF